MTKQEIKKVKLSSIKANPNNIKANYPGLDLT